jgi:hypothetical protein
MEPEFEDIDGWSDEEDEEMPDSQPGPLVHSKSFCFYTQEDIDKRISEVVREMKDLLCLDSDDALTTLRFF